MKKELLIFTFFLLSSMLLNAQKSNLEEFTSDSLENTNDTISYFLEEKNSKISLRDSLLNELITYGKSFLGSPYKYGGRSKAGFDCSGYVSTVFSKIGVNLSYSSVGMSGSGRVVADSTIQAGDILFFVNTQRGRNGIGHVGFVIEVENKEVLFLHSACNGGVKYEYLSHPYYKKHYYKAERIPLFDID
ncbi:MAG: C40 family peptidase [Bacteroidales bacterium]|nr:C40 family peptidase [Bacteroidales bacterium]